MRLSDDERRDLIIGAIGALGIIAIIVATLVEVLT